MTSRIPRLHLIGPLDAVAPGDYPALTARAVVGGVDAVHLRLPGGAAGEMLEAAREIARRCRPARLIVNDRLDIALLAEAGGVQLGERGLAVVDVRQLLGPGRLIGRSVHDLAGARRAAADGADFLLAGHVFETPSHPGAPGRGAEWLHSICVAVAIPVIALGGVTAERVQELLNAGAHGVAVGREILRAADPAGAARDIRSRLPA